MEKTRDKLIEEHENHIFNHIQIGAGLSRKLNSALESGNYDYYLKLCHETNVSPDPGIVELFHDKYVRYFGKDFGSGLAKAVYNLSPNLESVHNNLVEENKIRVEIDRASNHNSNCDNRDFYLKRLSAKITNSINQETSIFPKYNEIPSIKKTLNENGFDY